MEQNNSTEQALQQLISMQGEQVSLLQDLVTNSTQTMLNNTSQQLADANTNINTGSNFGAPNANFNMDAYRNYDNSGNGNYGNNMYGPPAPVSMSPMFSNPTQQSMSAFQDSRSNLNSSGRGYSFIDAISGSSRLNTSGRTIAGMDLGSRVGQAAILAGSTGLGIAADLGVGSMFPGIFSGMVAGSLASGGVTAYAAAGIDEFKKQAAYEKYLQRESYRFINPFESDNKRDVSGFSMDESKNAATYLRGLSNKFYMKDEEMMTLTQHFTEGGLLKDSSDLKSFKGQMETLTKSVKTGALLLNESYDSIADLMSEMKKAGIDQKDFKSITSQFKTLGSLTGTSASDLTRDITNFTTSVNAGTGNNIINSTERMNDITLYMDKWQETLKGKTNRSAQEERENNLIYNLGGPEQASKYAYQVEDKLLDDSKVKLASSYFFDYDTKSQQWKFNRDSFNQFTNGDMDFQQLSSSMENKLNNLSQQGYGNAVLDYQNNMSTYVRNNLSDGDVSKMLLSTVKSYGKSQGLTGASLNTNNLLGLMGITDSNEQTLLGGFLDFRNQAGDGLSRSFKMQSAWQESTAELQSQMPSIGERASSYFSGLKKELTQPLVDTGDWFMKKFVDLGDWVNGYKPEQSEYNIAKKFDLTSDLKSISYKDVNQHYSDTYDKLENAAVTLDNLNSKGFDTSDLSGKLNSLVADRNKDRVDYTRQKITSWDNVSSDIKENKDLISALGDKYDISDTILSALVKWSKQDTDKNKLPDKMDSIAKLLSEYMVKYGGNSDLALAASYNNGQGASIVDSALKKSGYDVSKLDSEGLQSVLKQVDMEKISKDLTSQVMDYVSNVKGQQITATQGSNSTTGGTAKPVSGNIYNADEEQKVGVGLNYNYSGANHEAITNNADVLKKLSSSYGVSDAALAALLMTESGKGDQEATKSIQTNSGVVRVTGAAQMSDGTFNGTVKGQASKLTGQTFTDFSQVEQDKNLNIEAGTMEFKKTLDNAGGNLAIAYGMYNAGIGGMSNLLLSAGYNQATWGNLSSDQVLQAVGNYGSGETATGIKNFLKYYNNVRTEGSTQSTSSANSQTSLQTEDVSVSKDKSGNKLKDQKIKSVKDFSSDASYQKGIEVLQYLDYSSDQGQNSNLSDLIDSMASKVKSGARVSALGGTSRDYLSNALKSIVSDTTGKQDGQLNDGDFQKIVSQYGLSDDLKSFMGSVKTYRTGKQGTNRDDSVVKEFGTWQGITEDKYGGDYGAYSDNLYTSAVSFVNNTAKQMQDYKDYLSGKTSTLTDDAKTYQSLDVSQKAMFAKMYGKLRDVHGVKEALTGPASSLSAEDVDKNFSNYVSDTEKEQLKHIQKKDGSIQFNEYEETSSAKDISATDVINLQKDGVQVNKVAGLEKLLKDRGVSLNSKGATFDELKDAAMNQYTKTRSEVNESAEKLQVYKKDITDDKLLKLINQRDLDGVKAYKDEAINGIANDLKNRGVEGQDALKQAKDKVEDIISSLGKVKDVNIDNLKNSIDAIDELSKTAGDLGKSSLLIQKNLLSSTGQSDFGEQFKSILDQATKMAGTKSTLSDKDLYSMLENQGKLLKDGKVVAQFSAEQMEVLSKKIAESNEAALKSELEHNASGLESKLKGVGVSDDVLKLVDSVQQQKDKIDQLKKDLTSGDSKLSADDVKKKTDELKQAQSDYNDMVSKSVDSIEKDITDIGDTNKQMSEKLGGLSDTSNNFATKLQDYDNSIKSAMAILNKRIDSGWGVGDTVNSSSNPIESFFTNLIKKTQ